MTLKRLENGEIHFGEAKRKPGGGIECLVTIEETGEVVRFYATPNDDQAYGRELYEMLNTTYLSQVTDVTQAELDEEAKYVAITRRNRELVESDWLMTVDSPATNADEWKLYRQALRDITDQVGYPHTISWPIKPEYRN